MKWKQVMAASVYTALLSAAGCDDGDIVRGDSALRYIEGEVVEAGTDQSLSDVSVSYDPPELSGYRLLGQTDSLGNYRFPLTRTKEPSGVLKYEKVGFQTFYYSASGLEESLGGFFLDVSLEPE